MSDSNPSEFVKILSLFCKQTYVNSPEFYEVMIEILEENHARGRFPTTKVIKVIDEGLQIKVKL